jgi:hypothetical protein
VRQWLSSGGRIFAVAGERRKDRNWKTVGASGEEKGDWRKMMRIGNRMHQ